MQRLKWRDSQTSSPVVDAVGRGAPRRDPMLRRAIARFVSDVRALPANAIRPKWAAEVERQLDGRLPSTRKRIITRYRIALIDAYGPEHPALSVVVARGLSREITAARRKAVKPEPVRLPAAEPVKPIGPADQAGLAVQSRETVGRARTAPAAPAQPKAIGRPSVLRDAVKSFIERLRGTMDAAQIRAIWTAELAKHEGKADRTLKLYATQYYRPAVREEFGSDHPAMAIVKTPDEVVERIRADDRAQVADSHRHLVEVANWQEIVARGTRLLRSSDPLSLIAGLLCVTGRRPYEVVCTGHLSSAPVPGGASGARARWSVLFDGQAKTKGRPGTRQDAYEIPVLAEARVVLAAFEALRASAEGQAWAGLDNREFSRLTTGAGLDERIQLAEAVSDAFGDLWPAQDTLTPRKLRPLYAEIAHKHFGPASVSKNSFFSAILGHTMKDLETSLSYMDYHLGDGTRSREASASLANRLAAATPALS